jgi:hypothetical protein
MAQTRIAGNTVSTVTSHGVPRDRYRCVTSPAHALYSNGPCADTKETPPQHCCAAHALERAHRAATQQCREQIRHNIKMDLREIGWGGMDWIDLVPDTD